MQEESETKKIIFHPKMLPGVVISDPELTVGLPAHITAATGMDALAHNLEAYCAPGYHPMAEGIAIEGMRLVKDWLPRAVAEGGDIEARANMLAAASMGATRFPEGPGGDPLSQPSHRRHLRQPPRPHQRGDDALRAVLQSPGYRRQDAAPGGLAGPKGPKLCNGILDWVLGLREDLKIPHGLDGLGVDDSRAEEICRMAAVDPTAPTNPIPLEPDNLRQIFDAALDRPGRLTRPH